MLHGSVTILQSGQKFNLEPFFTDRTILEVKASIERLTGIHTKDQWLRVGGCDLDDDTCSMADYGFGQGRIELEVLRRSLESAVPVIVALPDYVGGGNIELHVRDEDAVAVVRELVAERGCHLNEKDYFLSFAGSELNPEMTLRSQGISRHSTLRFQPRIFKVRLPLWPGLA
jgi:hypothetical protein